MWTTSFELAIVTTAVILQIQIHPLKASHYSTCVGVSSHDQIIQSIGSEPFFEADPGSWFAYGMTRDYKDPNLKVKVYGVEVDGKVLRGWFHVVLHFPSDFSSFVIHAVDEDSNSVGEFVYNFPPCGEPGGHQEHEDLTEYMYLPCKALSNNDPLVSGGVKFLRNPDPNYRHLVPSSASTMTEFHFMYRLATTPCTQPDFFSVYAIAAKRIYADQLWQASTDQVFLNASDVIGATDPIPRDGTYDKISCHVNASYATYVTDLKENSFYPDSAPCNNVVFGKPSVGIFGGRCPAKNVLADKTTTHRQNEAKCPSTGVAVNGLKKYEDYLKEMEIRYEAICTPCQINVPPRPITTPPPPPNSNDKIGVPFTIVTALEVWDGRIIHGMAMTIISIFLLPLNIFITRHYKETFMGTRILFLRVWYFIHHFATGVIILFYFFGFGRIIRNRKLLGVNLHPMAMIHRLVGWTSVGVTLAMALFGGWRCMSRLPRNCCIAFHWAIGMVVYIANYSLMIGSVWIPGSPAAAVDMTHNFKDGTDGVKKMELIVFLVIGWIVLDLGFHVIMTVLTCLTDRKYKLAQRRLYLPSPIPVFREHVTEDMQGSKIRILMLVVYGTLSLCITLGICYLLIAQDVSGRSLGEMSCTHKPKGRGLLEKNAITDCNKS